MNTMRFDIMKKLDLDTFELSQNYTLFYDKLEKANYFLESILDTLEEPTNGRVIAHLLMAPLNDGGQWDMFCNLMEKYGVVPKDAMPETACSSATREITVPTGSCGSSPVCCAPVTRAESLLEELR